MKDSIGDRMKDFYEGRTRVMLPRRAYTIIRIDGKAFHTFTRGMKKPFDDDLISDMDYTACYLCKNIMGADFAFVQSDEISILVTDFAGITTQGWFDNNLQKMCSVSASMATSAFNSQRVKRWLTWALSGDMLLRGQVDLILDIEKGKFSAEFDSRVFQIPSKTEVENYFIWRQQDTVRNSISSVAQNLFSPKELHGKSTDQMQEMTFSKGVNWNDFEAKYKRGRMIIKKEFGDGDNLRSKWVSIDVPIFTQERDFISSKILDNN